MKKRNGFTLIELLAVIVILAIIALVAVPIVLNMIENSKKNAAKSSALGFIEAIEYGNGIADAAKDNSGIDNPGYTLIADGTYTDVSVLNPLVKNKGEKPSYVNVTISGMKVTSADLCIGGYSVHYENNTATVGSKCSGTYTAPEPEGPSSASEVGYTNAANPNVHSVEDALNDLYGQS